MKRYSFLLMLFLAVPVYAQSHEHAAGNHACMHHETTATHGDGDHMQAMKDHMAVLALPGMQNALGLSAAQDAAIRKSYAAYLEAPRITAEEQKAAVKKAAAEMRAQLTDAQAEKLAALDCKAANEYMGSRLTQAEAAALACPMHQPEKATGNAHDHSAHGSH